MSETPTYLLLDGHQGAGPRDGWRAALLDDIAAGREALRLSEVPAPPVPLVDDHGTFGGLENPTGAAIAPDGAVYVSDAATSTIVKIVTREGIAPWALFFKIAGGEYADDKFVWVPTAKRLERWPRSIRTVPASLDDVEVISTEIWDATMARCLVEQMIGSDGHACTCGSGGASGDCGCGSKATASGGCGCGGTKGASASAATASDGSCSCGCGGSTDSGAGTIAREWEEAYPTTLPAGPLCKNSTTYLRCIGGEGTAPRMFNGPRGLAISRTGLLYVADTGNHRVQCFTLEGLALKNIWGRRITAADLADAPAKGYMEDLGPSVGDPAPGAGLGEFHEPWDVALDAACDLWIADRGNGRVQKLDLDADRFTAHDGTVLAAHMFQVLYGPAANRRYAWIPAIGRLETWSGAPGTTPASAADTEVVVSDVADLEAARSLVLADVHASGSRDILVEWDAAYPAALGTGTAFTHPEHLVVDAIGRVYVTDAASPSVTVLDSEGRALDHLLLGQQVDAAFPPTAMTLTADGDLLIANGGTISRVSTSGGGLTISGRHQHCCGARAMACDEKGRTVICGADGPLVTWTPPFNGFKRSGTYISAAIDSVVDRCQWHRIELELAEPLPTSASITVSTFTSATALTDVEIAGLTDDDWRTVATNATDFLVMSGQGRYLWLKIAMLGDGGTTPIVRHIVAHYPRESYLQYLPAIYQADPVSKDFMERFLSIFETVFSSIELKVDDLVRYLDPDGVPADFLPWLGSWVDMLFLPTWTTAVRRRLLRHAPELYAIRGTPLGLRRFIQLALGIDVRIQEGFKQRRWTFLSNNAGLNNGAAVWGDAIVSRLQLDQYATIGEFALVSTGDPLRDPFHVYAHTFTVFVNASDARNEAAMRLLRYLIDREKPAHTSYTIRSVESRFRVGVQSTIGLDTTVGIYPQTVLNQCATLGCDTVLAAAPQQSTTGLRVATRSRIGSNAVVG